jgi:hypothetical protein
MISLFGLRPLREFLGFESARDELVRCRRLGDATRVRMREQERRRVVQKRRLYDFAGVNSCFIDRAATSGHAHSGDAIRLSAHRHWYVLSSFQTW